MLPELSDSSMCSMRSMRSMRCINDCRRELLSLIQRINHKMTVFLAVIQNIVFLFVSFFSVFIFVFVLGVDKHVLEKRDPYIDLLKEIAPECEQHIQDRRLPLNAGDQRPMQKLYLDNQIMANWSRVLHEHNNLV